MLKKLKKNTRIDTMKKLILILAIGFLLTSCTVDNGDYTDESNRISSLDDLSHENEDVRIYYFWGDGCPICAQQKPFMDKLEEEYEVDILKFEVYNDRLNQRLFQNVAAEYEVQASGVPMTFIGEESWVGFNDRIESQIESKVEECLEERREDPFV